MVTVLKHYQGVIENVIDGVRESFNEDGVDERVLKDLKRLWETKLIATNAVDEVKKEGICPSLPRKPSKDKKVTKNTSEKKIPERPIPETNKTADVAPDQGQGLNQEIVDAMVTTQIRILTQTRGNEEEPRVFTIKLPSSAMQDDRLHNLLTSSIIAAITNMSTEVGSSILQQHINAAFCSNLNQNRNEEKRDAVENKENNSDEEEKDIGDECGSKVQLEQVDGCFYDSSDDEEINSKEECEVNFDEDAKEIVLEGPEETPLNSGDDLTDEEISDLFDSENIVVCQYEKITRMRNKWKLNLKAGIMFLDGRDFLFHKAIGDTEW